MLIGLSYDQSGCGRQGLVFPVRKRLGPYDYVYLAIRALLGGEKLS
jgi:hypothetical protein